MYRVGIDVGGTFTDVVAVDDGGRVTLAKAASTPADPSIGVLDGLAHLAETLGQARETLLGQTQRIVHGTTAATNALLENKGARVGLLTTEGHRDILEMREGYKHDRYNLRMAAPEPLVPRARRLGVCERVRADGTVAVPLDVQQLEEAIRQLSNDGVGAVAVCYLHAYSNPAHERTTGAAVRRDLPHVFVTLSSEVLPQIKGVRASLYDSRQRLCRAGAVELPFAPGRTVGGGGLPRRGAYHAVAWGRDSDCRGQQASGRCSAFRAGGRRRGLS